MWQPQVFILSYLRYVCRPFHSQVDPEHGQRAERGEDHQEDDHQTTHEAGGQNHCTGDDENRHHASFSSLQEITGEKCSEEKGEKKQVRRLLHKGKVRQEGDDQKICKQGDKGEICGIRQI